jgi:hypothetical protein
VTKYNKRRNFMAIKLLKTTKNKNIFNNEDINKKYSKVTPAVNSTPATIQQNIFKTAPTASAANNKPGIIDSVKNAANSVLANQNTNNNPSESVADILRANYPTLSGGGSSYSGNGAGMIDISAMLKAYDQAAESNKAVVEQSYNTQRNDLLTSLKRFQEQNAKDVAAQQKAFLSNQALVESAIAEADRSNRINASARGLGGSGLQQLAQLQTLMSQGQTISDLASENQNVVNNLREVLANYDEDTSTALKDLETTRENSLKGINSDLAMNKANLEYQAKEAAANRAQMEASTNAQIAAQNAEYEAAAREDERALNSQLAILQGDYEEALNSIKNMSNKEIKKAFKDENGNSLYKNYDEAKKGIYDTYRTNLSSILGGYNVGGTALANTQYQNLKDLYTAVNSSYVKPTLSPDAKKAINYGIGLGSLFNPSIGALGTTAATLQSLLKNRK